jgi:hypothetical protein
MHMMRLRLIVVVVVFAWLAAAPLAAAAAGGHATPEEVVAKVRQAAAMLAKDGEAGLPAFRGPASAYVWKDSYVFVSDCGQGVILAHPYQPKREGQPIAAGPTYDGVTAAERQKAQCETAARPDGGWWEYRFPKPGAALPMRKVSYLLAVPGRSWIVGAGVYDATTPLSRLEAVSNAKSPD